MAWNIHWQVPFMSKNGVSYLVNIHEQDYTGSIVTLTGTAQPFTTQEDDSDDIFMPIRSQSGYIRIVTNDTSLIDSICPSDNLQHLVTLTTDGEIKWAGFQSTDIYTQEWRNGYREIELPVNSLLASVEYTQLTIDKSSGIHSFRNLIYNIFSTFGIDIQFAFIWNILYSSTFFDTYVYSELFFEESTEEGQLTGIKVNSKSGKDVLESICKVFGLQAREFGNIIYFIAHGRIIAGVSKPFINLSQLASQSPLPDYLSNILLYPSLANKVTQWKNDDNSEGRLHAIKDIKISIKIEDYKDKILNIPSVDYDEQYPIYNVVLDNGTLNVQPQVPTVNDQFIYGIGGKYNLGYIARDAPTRVSDEILATVEANAAWHGLWTYNQPVGSTDPVYIYVGAFPCRWSFSSSATDIDDIQTQSGFVLLTAPSYYTPNSPSAIFHAESSLSYEFTNGEYIGIDISFLELEEGYYSKTGTWQDRTEYTISQRVRVNSVVTKLIVSVKVGNYYWDGSSWTTNFATFNIFVENGKIRSNYDSSMDIDNTQDFLLPISSDMSGNVEINLYDTSDTTWVEPLMNSTLLIGRTHFMNVLNVTRHYPSDSTSLLSDRSENIYKERILGIGYNGEKKIENSIGTYNYNKKSPSFIVNSNKEYITGAKFLYLSQEANWNSLSYKDTRYEMEFIERMKSHLSAVRRTYEADVELYKNREIIQSEGTTTYREMGMAEVYVHIDNRTYMIIDANHDWRDDTQRVKFIELY